MDTFVYEIDGKLYINLTNRCSNDCEFCVRNGKDSYYGNKLWLSKEPTAEEVLALIPDFGYSEVVFCGFGEPTFKMKEVSAIGKELKKRGFFVRINTNGQGNLINGRDITEELVAAVDKVNVSLNAGDRDKYYEICRPVFGEDAFDAILDFASLCKDRGIITEFSIVDVLSEKDKEKCEEIAERLGIRLRIRKYIQDS